MGAIKLNDTSAYITSKFQADLKNRGGASSSSSSSSLTSGYKDSIDFKNKTNVKDYGFGDLTRDLLNTTAYGSLFVMGVDKFSDWVHKSYEDRADELGLDIFKKSTTASGFTPFASSQSTTGTQTIEGSGDADIALKPKSADDKETLLDILKQGANNTGGLSETLLFSNYMLFQSINRLTDVVSLNNQVTQAYADANLELALDSKKISDLMAQIAQMPKSVSDVELAYMDLNAENMLSVVEKLNNISIVLSNLNISVNKTDKENQLIDKKLAHLEYETTPIQLDNLGDTIPEATPQQMRAVKDAVMAKKYSDENTFDLDVNDIDDLFGSGIPDISDIFTFSKKTDRLSSIFP